MNLAQVDINPACPWKNKTEWLSVYHQVLSEDDKDWEAALQTLSRWVNMRNCIPAHIAASVPVLRARCVLQASLGGPPSPTLPASLTPALLVNWAVRIAVIEFVNIFVKGVEAECSGKSQQASLHQLSVEAGLPQDLIPLRNSLVHATDVASTPFLQAQVVNCMWRFLKTKYWDVEYLVLRRREELLGHVERNCVSVNRTTEALQKHVAAILAAVQASNRKKTGLSNAPSRFMKLKELLLKCLKYVKVFSSEGKVRDRDLRTQDVVRILVEDLLLAPAFVEFLCKDGDSCTCGCLLSMDCVPLRKLLAHLVTQPPSADVLCRDAAHVGRERRQLQHHRRAMSLCNHLLSVLLENIAAGTNTRTAALQWFWLLVGNCAPYASPPATSPLTCPHHNLFLSPIKLPKVDSGRDLRDLARTHLPWSGVLLRMLDTGVTEVMEEVYRLLPVCLESVELLQSACDRPAQQLEYQKLRALERQLKGGCALSEEEYKLLYPLPGREEQREALRDKRQQARAGMQLLLQRQLVACPDGDVKPCNPLGCAAPPASGSVHVFSRAAAAADDKQNDDSTMHSEGNAAPDDAAGVGAAFSAETLSTDEAQTNSVEHSTLDETSPVSCDDSKNGTEESSSVSSARPNQNNEQNHCLISNAELEPSSPLIGLDINAIPSKDLQSFSKVNEISCNSQPTESKVNSIPSGDQPTESKVNSTRSGDEPTESKVNSIPSGDQPTESKVNKIPSGDQPTESKVNSIPSGDQPTGSKVNSIPSGNQPKESKVNKIPSGDQPTGSKVNSIPSGDQPTGSKVNRTPSKNRPSPKEKQNSSQEKSSPKCATKKLPNGCGLKSKGRFPSPKGQKKRKVE